MKKFLALLLSVLMMGTVLTACGEEGKDDNKSKDSSSDSVSNDESKDESKDESSKDDDSKDQVKPMDETIGEEVEFAKDDLTKAMAFEMTKEFTMDYSIKSSLFEMPLIITTDGTNVYMKMNMLGIDMTMLLLEGKAYGIDDASKVYAVTDADDFSLDEMVDEMDITSEFSEYTDKVTKAEKVTIDGKEYIRYTAEVDTEKMYIYTLDNKLSIVATMVDDEAEVVVINEMSNKARADLLAIPEGYEEVTAEEYEQLLTGGLTDE